VQARSQEARANWENALDTKDRAITQLEEALESSKRALVRNVSSQQQQAPLATGNCCSRVVQQDMAAWGSTSAVIVLQHLLCEQGLAVAEQQV
jgi:hypothetical protein